MVTTNKSEHDPPRLFAIIALEEIWWVMSLELESISISPSVGGWIGDPECVTTHLYEFKWCSSWAADHEDERWIFGKICQWGRE